MGASFFFGCLGSPRPPLTPPTPWIRGGGGPAVRLGGPLVGLRPWGLRPAGRVFAVGLLPPRLDDGPGGFAPRASSLGDCGAFYLILLTGEGGSLSVRFVPRGGAVR